jgi:hypothetical protein
MPARNQPSLTLAKVGVSFSWQAHTKVVHHSAKRDGRTNLAFPDRVSGET